MRSVLVYRTIRKKKRYQWKREKEEKVVKEK